MNDSWIGRRCTNKFRPTEIAKQLGFSEDVQVQCIRNAHAHKDHESFLLNVIVKWNDEAWPA